MNFDNIIQRVWPKVRKRHLYPELPMPEIMDVGDEDVSIQMEGKTIHLNGERLMALAQVMDAEDAASKKRDALQNFF